VLFDDLVTEALYPMFRINVQGINKELCSLQCVRKFCEPRWDVNEAIENELGMIPQMVNFELRLKRLAELRTEFKNELGQGTDRSNSE
jgi:hypothetical protein